MARRRRNRRGGQQLDPAIKGATVGQQVIIQKARTQGYDSLSLAEILRLTPYQREWIGLPGYGNKSDPFPETVRDTNPKTKFAPSKVVPGPNGPMLVPADEPAKKTKTKKTAGKTKPNLNYLPEDAQYALDRQARQGTLDTALGNARTGEDLLASDYGFGFDRYSADVLGPNKRPVAYQGDINFDTFRAPTSYDPDRGFDTANPFSRASKLNEAFTTARKTSRISYANRGLLDSGAYARQMRNDANNYNSALTGLRNEFASKLNEFRSQRGQARNDYSTNNIQDRRALIDRALQQWRINNP